MGKSIKRSLIASLIILFGLPSICGAASEGYWKVVDVKKGKTIKAKDRCSEQVFTPSEGAFSYRIRYFKGVCNHRNEEIFSTRSAWTPPPGRMNSGDTLSFQLQASRISNIPGYFLSHGVSVSIDKPGCLCGGVCGGRELGRAEADSKSKVDTVYKTALFEVPAGSKNASFALRFCPTRFGYKEGFRYVYQWVEETRAEMARKDHLMKDWFFWQDEYCSLQNDLLTPQDEVDEKKKKLEDIEGKLERIKKTYESEFGAPFPNRDCTTTHYPPQTLRQKEALRLYEQFKRVSEDYKDAAEREAEWLENLRDMPLFNTRKEKEQREAITRRKESLGKDLKQIKKEWDDTFHRDFGPLRTKKIADPQHHPLDKRLPRRQVDEMVFKIKGGSRFGNCCAKKKTTSTPTPRLSTPPERHVAEPEKTEMPLNRSDAGEVQSLGKKATQQQESQPLPSVKDEGVPKGHTSKYGF